MINMKVRDYRITSDGNQVIVNKVRRDEVGNIRKSMDKKTDNEIESLALVGYYKNLEHALEGIVRHHALSDDVLIQTVQDYKRACHDIVRAFQKEIQLDVNTDDNQDSSNCQNKAREDV